MLIERAAAADLKRVGHDNDLGESLLSGYRLLQSTKTVILCVKMRNSAALLIERY